VFLTEEYIREEETTIKGERHKKYLPRNKVLGHIESCGKLQ
jgi:hypothetical protein